MCISLPSPVQDGSHISRYMDNPGGELQKTLAKIGTDSLLDMVNTASLVNRLYFFSDCACTYRKGRFLPSSPTFSVCKCGLEKYGWFTRPCM